MLLKIEVGIRYKRVRDAEGVEEEGNGKGLSPPLPTRGLHNDKRKSEFAACLFRLRFNVAEQVG